MDEEIKKRFEVLEKRILGLENQMGQSKKTKIKKDHLSLSDHITTLREEGFFSQPKTADETHKKLAESYSCEPNRVAVALIRFVDRKQLRKASKIISGKTYAAYVW